MIESSIYIRTILPLIIIIVTQYSKEKELIYSLATTTLRLCNQKANEDGWTLESSSEFHTCPYQDNNSDNKEDDDGHKEARDQSIWRLAGRQAGQGPSSYLALRRAIYSCRVALFANLFLSLRRTRFFGRGRRNAELAFLLQRRRSRESDKSGTGKYTLRPPLGTLKNRRGRGCVMVGRDFRYDNAGSPFGCRLLRR